MSVFFYIRGFFTGLEGFCITVKGQKHAPTAISVPIHLCKSHFPLFTKSTNLVERVQVTTPSFPDFVVPWSLVPSNKDGGDLTNGDGERGGSRSGGRPSGKKHFRSPGRSSIGRIIRVS